MMKKIYIPPAASVVLLAPCEGIATGTANNWWTAGQYSGITDASAQTVNVWEPEWDKETSWTLPK